MVELLLSKGANISATDSVRTTVTTSMYTVHIIHDNFVI